jgi:hypothetical protein
MFFTVKATFSDFTFAVEQYDTASPDAAIAQFIEHAVAMANYDRAEWLESSDDRVDLIHVGGGIRGVWIWTPRISLAHDEIALLGGIVVHTDRAGPQRPAAA